MEFRRFPTQLNIRVLSKVYEAIELLTFHREIAPLRTDRDHEQKLVLPRYLHFPSRDNSMMGFLDFLKVSILSELKSLLLSIVH